MSRATFLWFLSPFLLLLVGGLVMNSLVTKKEEDPSLALYREVLGVVSERYVIAPDREALALAATRAMMKELDPHCRVYDESQWGAQQERSHGEYAGLGVLLGRLGGRVAILEVTPGGSAAAAGVQDGDFLVAIDGVPIDQNLEVNEAVAALRGQRGESVRLTLRPLEGGLEREVSVARDLVPQLSAWAAAETLDDVGHLVVTRFATNTVAQTREALAALLAERPVGLVLDLRGNRGGSLTAALEIADLFLAEGALLATVGRTGVERYRARPADTDCTLPLVVLVDRRSASASEVVAGALQDHGRAVLLGTRTYGKGVVQEVVPLRSMAGGMKLTTKHYFTPAGRCIEGRVALPDGGTREGGLRPDVPLALTPEQWALAQRARERARLAAPVRTRLNEESPFPEGFEDPALRAAVDLLRGRALADRTL